MVSPKFKFSPLVNKAIPITIKQLKLSRVAETHYYFLHFNIILFIWTSRVIKTSLELEVLRYANQVSSAAHIAVMKAAKPG